MENGKSEFCCSRGEAGCSRFTAVEKRAVARRMERVAFPTSRNLSAGKPSLLKSAKG